METQALEAPFLLLFWGYLHMDMGWGDIYFLGCFLQYLTGYGSGGIPLAGLLFCST